MISWRILRLKMSVPPCEHWRIWRLAGSWAELDAIKSDRVGVEVGVHQRDRRHRRIAREQDLPAHQIGRGP